MTKKLLQKGALTFGLLCALSSASHAEGCTIEDVKLDCGSARTATDITEAFAAEETSKALSNPYSKLDLFQRPADLETFRRSVEKTWREARLAERFVRSKLRRRIISAAQFEEWAKTYNRAEVNYNKAIDLYRTLVWHGKNGKPAPVDTDS